MPSNLIEFSASADQHPLLVKHLLPYPLSHAPDQEIVYRDLTRHTYEESVKAKP
jgi:fatty-acyl-CoA synthase